MSTPPGSLTLLLKVSRWRFWLYLAGTYLIGFTIGVRDLNLLPSGWFWLHFAYFTLPANLLLYGVNDLFDTDTDAANPKKTVREHLLASAERPFLVRAVSIAFLLNAALAAFQKTSEDRWMLALFVALSVFYSAPPVRFKARPFLDSLSNVLYAVPGFLGFQHASGQAVPWQAVAVACLWTSAMHLFSAIPDIGADRKAGLNTTATVMGHRASLVLCAVLWLVFAAIVMSLVAFRPYGAVLLVYPAIALALLFKADTMTGRVYWFFPLVNALVGMGAFFVVAFSK